MNIAFPDSDTRRGRVIDEGDIAPTLDTGCTVGRVCASRKRGDHHEIEHRKDGNSNALTTIETDNMIDEGLRIRKLTPKECFRLQGISDEMFERAAFVNSDSQLYKQAGNACTCNVVYDIAKRMEKHESRID